MSQFCGVATGVKKQTNKKLNKVYRKGAIMSATVSATVSTSTTKAKPRFVFIEQAKLAPSPHGYEAQCSKCNVRESCLPCGLNDEEAHHVDHLVQSRRRIKRGDSVYRNGDPFKSLYAVRSGFFMTYAITEDGREQITGFQMPSDIVGMDGIGTELHKLNVVALEDSEVCVIPLGKIEDISTQVPKLQRELNRMMSREIVRDQVTMIMLGTMRAEERVAAFLLNLSQRFAALGYSPSEFYLRMTRDQIGCYLGLKLETISRIFSKFQDCGLLTVQNKRIQILDRQRLKSL
jgi:CRP/FNR family transcriptional regulator